MGQKRVTGVWMGSVMTLSKPESCINLLNLEYPWFIATVVRFCRTLPEASLGVISKFWGESNLSMMWMTPLVLMTSLDRTFALLFTRYPERQKWKLARPGGSWHLWSLLGFPAAAVGRRPHGTEEPGT